jgi:hypothetical protein
MYKTLLTITTFSLLTLVSFSHDSKADCKNLFNVGGNTACTDINECLAACRWASKSTNPDFENYCQQTCGNNNYKNICCAQMAPRR